MSIIFRSLFGGVMLAALFPLSTTLAGEPLVFSTAPTQTPTETVKMYQPLVDHLARQTGKSIVLKPAKNFLEYTHGIQHGRYDIVFDGPHFVGWRMEKIGHQVVAKLPGNISFVVVARDDAGIVGYKTLAGRKVCTFASPNLLSLGFLDLFGSPASQPILVRVGSFKGALECVQNGNGVAAVMRDKFWEKRKPEQIKGLSLIYTTDRPFPHRAFSVGPRVNDGTRKKIAEALIGVNGVPAGMPILKKFRSKQFLPATTEEYKGMGALLNPVWGFRDL